MDIKKMPYPLPLIDFIILNSAHPDRELKKILKTNVAKKIFLKGKINKEP